MEEMVELKYPVNQLPQELFDSVYVQTFTIDQSFVDIDSSYHPPHQLQVDRSSREAFAKDYYSNTIFRVAEDLLLPWLSSLPRSHVRLIRDIRLKREHEPLPMYDEFVEGLICLHALRETYASIERTIGTCLMKSALYGCITWVNEGLKDMTSGQSWVGLAEMEQVWDSMLG